jgi:hypothetical protein
MKDRAWQRIKLQGANSLVHSIKLAKYIYINKENKCYFSFILTSSLDFSILFYGVWTDFSCLCAISNIFFYESATR